MLVPVPDELLGRHSVWFWLYGIFPTSLLVIHLVPYFIDPHFIRRNGITGPFLARFSDAWLGWVAAQGHRSEVVHDLHRKYGTFLRLAPNHVSVSDPAALPVIYGHGNGALKSDYYDTFVSIRRSIFTTRSRAEHTRKRKVVSHVFSSKSVLEFEPNVRQYVGELFAQWDKLCDGGMKGLSGSDGEGGWRSDGGRVWFNCMPWFTYLAFDITGDLAFGSAFGMIRNARDAAPLAVDQKAAMANYGEMESDFWKGAQHVCAIKEVPAAKNLNDLSAYSASIGVLPRWWRSVALTLPWYAGGSQALEDINGIAVASVAKRLALPTDRNDLLRKLQEGKDENGMPLSREELTAEAITMLIAGSDTTAISACAIAYHVIANPQVQTRLQKELDEVLGTPEDSITTYSQSKRMPYLEAVVHEGLRIHPTVALGLPRVVPEGGLTVCGKFFPEGTILSVPTYTIHRDQKVWGEDADVFRPERWLEHDQMSLQKTFNAFSYGPRACVGRNLAMMEQFIIISSIFHRYAFELEQSGKSVKTHEGFTRKLVECCVGMKRREICRKTSQ